MSKRIPNAFIQQLIERADIVDVIGARLSLKKRGANFLACCPFHQEKSPSFTVSQNKQIYHCFGCGVSGNAIGFLMEYDRLEFVAAIQALAAIYSLDVPYEGIDHKKDDQAQDLMRASYAVLVRAKEFYHKQLHSSEHASQLAYLQARGVTQTSIDQFSLGYAPNQRNVLSKFGKQDTSLQPALIATGMLIEPEVGPPKDRFYHRIMFPIFDRQGRVIAFGGRALNDDKPKYLNSPETLLFHKSRELYGFYQAKLARSKDPYFVVVEGYLDVIAMHQAGLTNTVGTLGTALTQEHMQLLLKQSKEIIFCFDGDEAGRRAAWRGLEVSLPSLHDGVQIKFAFLPESEDPDTYVKSYGAEKMRELLENAMPLSDFFFQQLSVDVNLNSIDGRASLASQAKGLLAKMPKGVFSNLMEEKLSAITRVQTATKSGQNEPRKNYHLRQAPTRHATANRASQITPLRLLMALWIQHPKLYSKLPENFFQIQVESEQQIFMSALHDYFESEEIHSTAQLLEHFRETEFYGLLIKLATLELPAFESGLEAEFSGALARIEAQQRAKEIENLLSKAHQQGLTDQEKIQLQGLLRLDRFDQIG